MEYVLIGIAVLVVGFFIWRMVSKNAETASITDTSYEYEEGNEEYTPPEEVSVTSDFEESGSAKPQTVKK